LGFKGVKKQEREGERVRRKGRGREGGRGEEEGLAFQRTFNSGL
jgi:hypothetical protein